MSHRSAAIASRGIELALQGKTFRFEDVRHPVNDAPDQSTIYRVLAQLEADGWIINRGNEWQPAEKATNLGEIDPDN